jgi:hypothetical protein
MSENKKAMAMKWPVNMWSMGTASALAATGSR